MPVVYGAIISYTLAMQLNLLYTSVITKGHIQWLTNTRPGTMQYSYIATEVVLLKLFSRHAWL